MRCAKSLDLLTAGVNPEILGQAELGILQRLRGKGVRPCHKLLAHARGLVLHEILHPVEGLAIRDAHTPIRRHPPALEGHHLRRVGQEVPAIAGGPVARPHRQDRVLVHRFAGTKQLPADLVMGGRDENREVDVHLLWGRPLLILRFRCAAPWQVLVGLGATTYADGRKAEDLRGLHAPQRHLLERFAIKGLHQRLLIGVLLRSRSGAGCRYTVRGVRVAKEAPVRRQRVQVLAHGGEAHLHHRRHHALVRSLWRIDPEVHDDGAFGDVLHHDHGRHDVQLCGQLLGKLVLEARPRLAPIQDLVHVVASRQSHEPQGICDGRGGVDGCFLLLGDGRAEAIFVRPGIRRAASSFDAFPERRVKELREGASVHLAASFQGLVLRRRLRHCLQLPSRRLLARLNGAAVSLQAPKALCRAPFQAPQQS
mmetsp:Transcript_57925/g.137943  ORF Transcript_57925/g.137943 Transcript_57925/m.137943 type:complete len:424 (+) Transcript_57925:1557-2828(+)